ncbi:hypothetical protein F4604DRAFT_1954144 [Suillus subluteus]|nr:hypothetical protein F4604DRAFT_1954144 [Suillus subluteus]
MDYYHNNGGRYNPDQFRSGVQRQQQEWPSYGYAVSHRLGNGQHSAPVGSYEHQAVVPAHTTTHQQQQENYHAEHYRYNMTRQQQQLGEQPYQSISQPEHLPNLRQVLEACGQPQLNEPAGDSRSHPVHSQQQPQPQKRGHEECESNLLENGDSAKKIRKTENDAPLTQTSEARTSKLEGSKQKATGTKAKTKAKIKVDGEQAMAHLQEQTHWSDEDTKLLLKTLLGTDSEFYEDLAGNAIRIFKKVSERIFKGRRTPESIKGRYERLRRVFLYILNFESITGNGGGDPDVAVLTKACCCPTEKAGEPFIDFRIVEILMFQSEKFLEVALLMPGYSQCTG